RAGDALGPPRARHAPCARQRRRRRRRVPPRAAVLDRRHDDRERQDRRDRLPGRPRTDRPARPQRPRSMTRLRAAAGSLLFLGVAPGVVAGLVPWLLTGWESTGPPVWLQALGWLLIVAGTAVLLEAFARFVLEGVGTPAPPAPTEHLVVGGLYRYVRNPMYLAVAAVILGQAAVLGSWGLVVYALAFGLTVWSFVHW